jgi:hypothetical protein
VKDTDAIDQERQRRGAELTADLRDAISLPPLPPSPAEVGDLILQMREHVQALGWGNREHLYTESQVRSIMADCAAKIAACELLRYDDLRAHSERLRAMLTAASAEIERLRDEVERLTPKPKPQMVERSLVERLRACADDPMWSDHAEIPKRWCSEAAEEIELLRDDAVILAETAREVERERCAKLCDEARAAVWPYHEAEVFKVAQTVCENLANRIRGLEA